MTLPFVIGADPGVPLTVALLSPKGKWVAHAVATSPEGLKNATKYNDPAYMAHVIRTWKEAAGDHPIVGVVEGVSPRPREGVVSVGKFMGSFWMVRTALSCFNIPYEIVWPNKWKPALGLDHDKRKSIALGKKMFPNRAWRLKLVQDHNFAEAALLAHYHRNAILVQRNRNRSVTQ